MPANPQIQILIVDDSKTLRNLLKGILEHAGFINVTSADNGQTAWEILEQMKIDLVITDWSMPQMNGLELLMKIRQSEKLKDLPVMLLTINTEKTYVEQALKAGANNYIAKPFDAGVIIKKINMVFDRQHPVN